MKTVDATPYQGKTVKMTGYIKSENVKNWAGLWMRVDFYSSKVLAFDNMHSRGIKGSKDWEKYEVVLFVPEHSTDISYGVLLDGTGQIWMKDIAIEIVSDAVAETGSIKGRMNDILNTKNHTLRRNLGNHYFAELPNYEKPSSRKSFCDEIEILLNEKIITDLTVSYILVELGRKELEERLYDKFSPKYSIKGKRGTKKAYTLDEKRILNKNAYTPWTEEDDNKLELLYCEGKSVKMLVDIFGRNKGAIESRIKKLELKEKYCR